MDKPGLVMRDSSVGDIALANKFSITSNGAIFDANGGTLTFSGNISGPGSLQAQDFTTTFSHVVLTGTNTYTGGTTVCFCATLVLGDGGTTGSIVRRRRQRRRADVQSVEHLRFRRKDHRRRI